MKRMITLGIGAALGYLLGSREGRKNLDKFAQNAQTFWKDPKTQEQVQRATTSVREQAPVMAERAAGLADKATNAVKDKAPHLAAQADKANAAAHTATEKGSNAAQGLAGRASEAAEKSTAGKHSSAEADASGGNTTVNAPTGDVVSDPSQSLESEGGGPDRY